MPPTFSSRGCINIKHQLNDKVRQRRDLMGYCASEQRLFTFLILRAESAKDKVPRNNHHPGHHHPQVQNCWVCRRTAKKTKLWDVCNKSYHVYGCRFSCCFPGKSDASSALRKKKTKKQLRWQHCCWRKATGVANFTHNWWHPRTAVLCETMMTGSLVTTTSYNVWHCLLGMFYGCGTKHCWEEEEHLVSWTNAYGNTVKKIFYKT